MWPQDEKDGENEMWSRTNVTVGTEVPEETIFTARKHTHRRRELNYAHSNTRWMVFPGQRHGGGHTFQLINLAWNLLAESNKYNRQTDRQMTQCLCCQDELSLNFSLSLNTPHGCREIDPANSKTKKKEKRYSG